MNLLNLAQRLLKANVLCDRCLGRQFALLGTETSNKNRGFALKENLLLEGSKHLATGANQRVKAKGQRILEILAVNGRYPSAVATLTQEGIHVSMSDKPCFLCGDIFQKIDKILKKAKSKVKDIEYDTFYVGSIIPNWRVEREDEIRSRLGIAWGEAIKREVNRVFGKALEKSSKRTVDFDNPDVEFIIDIESMNVDINIRPVFLYGRYTKHVRGIPQTIWKCPDCQGRGCEKCKGTGKLYSTSIEELISTPSIQVFNAESSRFHGAGREDIDALMLGTGRPFVLELISPIQRKIDLQKLRLKINRSAKGQVKVSSLGFTNKDLMRRLKARARLSSKTYKVLFQLDQPIKPEQLATLDASLTDVEIHQRTPLRVRHRRADKVRLKKIYKFKSTIKQKKKIEAIIRCQGGLYVKELVTGDNGRTSPNVAELLGMKAVCQELDVIAVETGLQDDKELT